MRGLEHAVIDYLKGLGVPLSSYCRSVALVDDNPFEPRADELLKG